MTNIKPAKRLQYIQGCVTGLSFTSSISSKLIRWRLPPLRHYFLSELTGGWVLHALILQTTHAAVIRQEGESRSVLLETGLVRVLSPAIVINQVCLSIICISEFTPHRPLEAILLNPILLRTSGVVTPCIPTRDPWWPSSRQPLPQCSRTGGLG